MTLPPSSPHDVSLARGGLLHALLGKFGLLRGDGHDLRRQVLAAVALGWFPLLVFAGLEMLQGRTVDQLVLQVSVHARTLLAVPLWLVTDHVLDQTCDRTLRRFASERLAEGPGLARIAQGANRWRTSWWPEVLLLVSALVLGQLTLWGVVGETGLVELQEDETAGRVTLLRVWYASVSLPLFNFLFVRTLWRWCLWIQLLKRVSTLPLRLVPTHPDRSGGISFVSAPAAALMPAVVATSSVLAGAWGDHILAGHAAFHEFRIPIAVFVLLTELVALGPALFFTAQLFSTRIRGLRQYGKLALIYTRGFHERWVDPGQALDTADSLLGSSDIQSLADLANSHALVERMRPVPVGKRIVLLVALGVLLPMLPLATTERSLYQIFTTIGRPLLGGVP